MQYVLSRAEFAVVRCPDMDNQYFRASPNDTRTLMAAVASSTSRGDGDYRNARLRMAIHVFDRKNRCLCIILLRPADEHSDRTLINRICELSSKKGGSIDEYELPSCESDPVHIKRLY